jgi:hypothetical protein
MSAKTNGNKRVIRFGDFIEAAYRAAGSRRAKELVRLAIDACLVVFRSRQRIVITED